jgi:hypothetical protein
VLVCVPKSFHSLDESLILFPTFFRDWIAFVIQRTPVHDFPDVLADDHVRPDCLCVFVDRPWKHPDVVAPGFLAFGPAEMCAVWACPHEANVLSFYDFFQIDFEDVFRQMDSVGMIDFVHGNRLLVVINGDVNVSPKGHFNANRCATTASKHIDY